MEKVFIKRAQLRSKVSYMLMIISIIVIVIGIILAIQLTMGFTYEISEIGLSTKNKDMLEAAQFAAEMVKYKYIIFTIILLSMLFFISQVLLKLYRYNMLKSDFYYSCADSFVLTNTFNEDERARFESLLLKIISEKITLTTPKSITLSDFLSKIK